MSEPTGRQRGNFMMTQQVKSTLDHSGAEFREQLYSILEELAHYGRTGNDIGRREIDGKTYRIAEVGDKHLIYRPLENSEKLSPDTDRNRDVFMLFDIT